MSKLNLVGQRFGRLIVVSEGDKKHRGKNIKRSWDCKCDCGNPITVFYSALVQKNSVSCGCYRRQRGKSARKRFVFPDVALNC